MFPRRLVRIGHRLPLLCMMLLGLVQVTCIGPSAGGLPFTTLARDAQIDVEGKARGDRPLLLPGDFLILTQAADANNSKIDTDVEVGFPPSLVTQLRAVDYEHNFVVLVFRLVGEVSSENTTIIQEVNRSGDEVILKVHYGSPPPGRPGGAADSYPNHLAMVAKLGQWRQDIHFILQVDGKEVKEHTYFIP